MQPQSFAGVARTSHAPSVVERGDERTVPAEEPGLLPARASVADSRTEPGEFVSWGT